jgi:uncharacterized membrane protein YfcA
MQIWHNSKINTLIYIYAFLFFLVALIYSAAGFGGGSMYLAILAQSSLSVEALRMAALSCNAVVTANGTWQFHKANWIVWRGVLALLICSVPPCLFTSSLHLSEKTYFISLAIALLIAAGAMLLRQPRNEQLTVQPLRWWMYPLSFVIGGVSGITGIGGGIYLAPFLYLSKWGSPKQIAGASSVFILVNSLAGLFMQVRVNGWQLEWTIVPLLVAVFIGGLMGSAWGSARFTHRIVRWMTIVIIIFAALRTLWRYL